MLSPRLLTYFSLWLAGILSIMTIILLTFPEFFAKRDKKHQLLKKRNFMWEELALFISHAIAMETVGIAYSSLTFLFMCYGLWRMLGIALSSMLLSCIVFRALKRITQRARPQDALLTLSDYSFPSGHTTAGFVIFLTIAMILSSFFFPIRVPWLYIGALVLWGVVGRSRRYLKVHRITDIFAGAVLWIGSFLAAYLFFLYFGDPIVTTLEHVFNSLS